MTSRETYIGASMTYVQNRFPRNARKAAYMDVPGEDAE